MTVVEIQINGDVATVRNQNGEEVAEGMGVRVKGSPNEVKVEAGTGTITVQSDELRVRRSGGSWVTVEAGGFSVFGGRL